MTSVATPPRDEPAQVLPAPDVYGALGSSPQGLSTADARARRRTPARTSCPSRAGAESGPADEQDIRAAFQ